MSNIGSSLWTPAREAEIQRRWANGQSASAIAAAIREGRFEPSRNAVIGKLHRMGASVRAVAHSPSINHGLPGAPPKRQPPRPVNPKPRPPKVNVRPVGAVVASTPKPWTERQRGECAWIVAGDGADSQSCCAPVHDRGWCAGHYLIGTVPTVKKAKAA